jgi:hypothetical protein
MQYYPLMPPDLKGNDELLVKLSYAIADKRAIYEMAKLA